VAHGREPAIRPDHEACRVVERLAVCQRPDGLCAVQERAVADLRIVEVRVPAQEVLDGRLHRPSPVCSKFDMSTLKPRRLGARTRWRARDHPRVVIEEERVRHAERREDPRARELTQTLAARPLTISASSR